MKKRTFGVELEKPISDKTSQLPHGMTQKFYDEIETFAQKRDAHPHRHMSDVTLDITLGITSDDLGEQGLDNGFNLQESALPYTTDLHALNEKVSLDITTVAKALKKENATFLNMANHPFGKTDEETYKKFVAPKGLYPYINYRGHTHRAGIDAKAQNSPATGVNTKDAADAVSVMIGFGAAMVGLFANSPIAEGEVSGFKESRLTMWKKMFGTSKVSGDLRVALFPEKRFRTMAQYFQWMFGGDSAIHFVLSGGLGGEYKNLGDRVLLIEGNPNVLDFLRQKEWKAQNLNDILQNNDRMVSVTPVISHMETMQFAQFTGGRIRYGLKDSLTPEMFISAVSKENELLVEELFEKHATFTYIEGRDPGANFPDLEIISAGDDIAKSVVISPSAIQAGLIENLSESVALLEKYDWKLLGRLREVAIKDGLSGEVDGITVKELAEKVIEVATGGIKPTETWMLSYPEWVLRSGKNGADRALEFVESHSSGGRQAIVDLVKSREIDISPYEN